MTSWDPMLNVIVGSSEAKFVPKDKDPQEIEQILETIASFPVSLQGRYLCKK